MVILLWKLKPSQAAGRATKTQTSMIPCNSTTYFIHVALVFGGNMPQAHGSTLCRQRAKALQCVCWIPRGINSLTIGGAQQFDAIWIASSRA
eukprot:scaffold739_cov66-Cyclotella_meneghiniana.AAC.5